MKRVRTGSELGVVAELSAMDLSAKEQRDRLGMEDGFDEGGWRRAGVRLL